MFHKCGIIGISNKQPNKTIFNNIIYGLLNLQHRGKESCGITYTISSNIKTYKKQGLVKDIFEKFKTNDKTKSIIGHVRYSTSGGKKFGNKLIQPFVMKNKKHGFFSLVHNGNIPHYKNFTQNPDILNDTLMLCEQIKNSDDDILDILKMFLKKIRFAFCLLIMFEDKIYTVRDSYGYRPLCLGKNYCGSCIASESCALGKYKFVRDIEPGEIGLLQNGKYKSLYTKSMVTLQKCIFEHIYFMNKNTVANNLNTEHSRYLLGVELANEEKLKFKNNECLVCAVPRTAIPIAKGYATEMGLQYAQILEKFKNYGRTFILPDNVERKKICNKIFSVKKEFIKDKDIILVDDSIVRGNTIQGISKLFFDNGCRSLHIRIGSPPVIGRCFYGIDIPTEKELIANHGINDLHKKLKVTSVQYLSLNGLKKCFGEGFCMGCFNKKYIEW